MLIALMLVGFGIQAQTVEKKRNNLSESYSNTLSDEDVSVWNEYEDNTWIWYILYKEDEGATLNNYIVYC